MSSELDLTFLTPEEINHLRNVLDRAKQVDQNHQDKAKFGNKIISSNEIFKAKKDSNPDSRTGREVVSDALNYQPESKIEIEQNETSQETKSAEEVDNSKPNLEESANEKETKEPANNTDINEVEPTVNVVIDEDNSKKQEENIKETNQTEDSPSVAKLITPVVLLDDKSISDTKDNDENEGEGKDSLAPLPETKTPDSPGGYDVESMVSRNSDHAQDFAGEINISLTYYPPEKVQQHDFPSTGTRLPDNNHLDVLTRKSYSTLSGAKIFIAKEYPTGAETEKDGELHLVTSSATDLQLPSVMKKSFKTYVKCYLLPDRYHGSKMRSEEVKDSLNPKYDHIFVFRGFSEAEFNERGIEIVIGGVVSTYGRHLVIGGVRLSDGKQIQDKPVPWKNSNEDEASLWSRAFEKPCTEVNATLSLRPDIKLTYK